LLFEFGILRISIAGSEAVILFFILSGFVLSLPFYSNRQIKYGAYAIRRICRIYIPYVVTIGLAVVLREFFYSGKVAGLTNWFNTNWSSSVDAGAAINHLLFIGTFSSNLNNVVWSLVHEMRISLVFPFIMFLLLRISWKTGIAFALLLSVGTVVYSFLTNASFVGTELYSTIHYSTMFVFGALLAKYREEICKKVLALNSRFKIILFLIGIIFYLYAHPSFIASMIIQDFKPFYRTVIDSWFISLGASILIIFAISSSKFSKILTNKTVNYIGKISYSLYLVHLPVLFSLVHLLNKLIPVGLICLIVVIVTFVLSSLMYYLVEKPAIQFGKFLTKPRGKEKPENIRLSTLEHKA
jgi:peptidoglycan/LPS O-acetylase OafA/YrhL